VVGTGYSGGKGFAPPLNLEKCGEMEVVGDGGKLTLN